MIVQDLFEAPQLCPECGGVSFSDLILAEKKDACYYKVKASAKVWPSAYASGRLVQCRKKGADNYGNSKNEGVAEGSDKYGFHTSVSKGKFLPSKYGQDENNLYLHDLMNVSGDGSGPQLVTIDDKRIATEIAAMYGGYVERTDMGTYRVYQPRGARLTTKKPEQQGVAEAAKWRQGYRASGHPPGYQHKSGEIGPLGGTYDTTSNYGDEVKVPVNRYRDEPDRLADREKTKLSTSGKPLTAKNAARNLKTAIGQAKGKHGPVGVLPEQGVAEAINPDITNPAFSHQQQIGDYLYVARYWGRKKNPIGLKISAYHGNKLIGHADLMYHSAPFDDFADPETTPNRIWLESEITEVNPKYQRQGIMSTMYAYARMLGNTVKPSQTRSDDAKAAWASWRQSGDKEHLTKMRAEGVAEGYQLDEGAMETISTLVKKLPGIGKYYQIAQQYKPQLVQILKTSKSGKEVKQKMEALLAQTSTPVAEAGWMKQLGGLAVGGGSILSTMWMNAMGMIDGVLAHAAAGEVGGAVASGSILGLIPVTLMLFAAMLLFKGSKQSSDEKAQAFQAQRGQQGVAEGPNEKIGGRHDPDDFDDMVRRLKKLAGAGPMQTQWDPKKRVYRNMPTAVQPPKHNKGSQ